MMNFSIKPPYRQARSLAISVIIFASSSLAMAAPLWKIDFASMEADQKIVTGNYKNGVVNSLPQKAEAGAEDGRITVRNNFTTGNATLTGHSVVLVKSDRTQLASDVRFSLIGSTVDYTARTNYELTFDVLLSASALLDATSLNVRMINDNSNTSVGAVVFHQDGSLSLNSAFATGVQTAGNVWKAGEVIHLRLQVDVDNQRFNVIVNNALVAFLSLDNTGAANPNLGINRIWFGANSANALFADGIAIANIEASNHLSPIPEASNIALLMGGGALLLICKRRNAYLSA